MSHGTRSTDDALILTGRGRYIVFDVFAEVKN